MRDPRAGCASSEAVLDPEPDVAHEIAPPVRALAIPCILG